MQITLSSACFCLILPAFRFELITSVKVAMKEHLRIEEAGSFLFYSINNIILEAQTLSIASSEIHFTTLLDNISHTLLGMFEFQG